MARKRLTPARPEFLRETSADDTEAKPQGLASEVIPARVVSAPIAQVAADVSANNALQKLSRDIEEVRAEGRMILKLNLTEIAQDHLVRDRLEAEPDEMMALANSITAHGQRMPIEVTELPVGPDGRPEGGARYGLISGWRRLTALEYLHRTTGEDRFGTVLALLRQPKDSADAYVAMVEENEIRVGLSYFERARVAVQAVERGIFETEKAALLSLFASASRAKRSRIRAFIELYTELGGALRFPTSISERLGLQIIYAMRGDAGLATALRNGLRNRVTANSEDEQETLVKLCRNRAVAVAKTNPAKAVENVPHAEQSTRKLPNGLVVTLKNGKITLKGPRIGALYFDKLCAVLMAEKTSEPGGG